MAKMVARSGELVSFAETFEVLVSTDAGGGDVWTRPVPFDSVETPGSWVPLDAVGADVSDRSVDIGTPDVGAMTQVRLVVAQTGSPDGDGEVIDELTVVRLDQGARQSFLTECSEGQPQLTLETGGTFVRAVVASGTAVSLAQLFVGRTLPVWAGSMPFPTFDRGDFLVSAVSDQRGFVHVLTAVDGRTTQRTTNPLLDAGLSIGFVTLVWDSQGAWDFTWTRTSGMPAAPTSTMDGPETLQTLSRTVDLGVARLVCLDDSDDLSDGEATFTVTMQPTFAAAETRSFGWDPMETGSVLAVNEHFTIAGREADGVWLNVQGLEDDSGSFPSDADDVANTPRYAPAYRQGPGLEAYREDAVLDSGVGNDGFHYLVHCSATVTYS